MNESRPSWQLFLHKVYSVLCSLPKIRLNVHFVFLVNHFEFLLVKLNKGAANIVSQ